VLPPIPIPIPIPLSVASSSATDSALFNRIWTDNEVMVLLPLPFCCASNRSVNALFWPNL